MSTLYTIYPVNGLVQCSNRLNQKEGRIYTNEELALLPEISKTHRHYKEWECRKKTFKRLQDHLQQRNDEPAILEVGCGNGWLSAKLAGFTSGTVTGIDINEAVLEQAASVFHHIPNLEFKTCSLSNDCLEDKVFDVIIFASSIQYFASLKKIITEALQYLSLQGEIHIMDTFFYRQNQISGARQLTNAYFKAAGVEAMSNFYFHHSMEDLKKFNHRVLYDPTSFFNRWGGGATPYHHIVIKNRYQ